MYAAPRYFATSYFGGIWPGLAEEGVIRPSSFVQTAVFGTPQLTLQVRPSSFEQQFLLGEPSIGLEVVSASVVQNVEFGTPELHLQVRATGLEQYVQFGTPGVALELEIQATGIDQFIEFGTPGIKLEVVSVGIVQPAEFGTPEVQLGVAGIPIHPTGFSQPIEFGIPNVRMDVFVQATGFSEYIEFGIPRVYSPEFLEFAIRLVPTEELAKINTRPTVAPVKFKSLLAEANNIFALSTGGNEMARAIKVTVNQSNTGQIISTNPIAIGTLPVTSTRLDALNDVNAGTEVEGGVPRYDAQTDKYVVEKLDFADITGDPGDFDINEIDGGTF